MRSRFCPSHLAKQFLAFAAWGKRFGAVAVRLCLLGKTLLEGFGLHETAAFHALPRWVDASGDFIAGMRRSFG
jgi:hypothetical protein